MSARDFELHFEKMGLEALPADVSCDSTFAPGAYDNTLASGPRAEITSLEAPLSGTLPRLMLATPDAARESPSADEVELIPVAVIGEGGMGRVLLARQHSLNREVAVKVLKANAVNDGAAAALVEEARTTGSLEHPGVVPVYALARDATGLPALVMKRVDGVSWRELIHDAQHPAWKTAAAGRDQLEANLEVLIQVCNAIAYAHRRGVIHRDIKPANVLVGELGEVYVADWGVAIQKAGLKPGQPRLIGTPSYLAPEMVTGDAALMDERTDVYLLGGTLHEVLTREPPHPGSGLREVLEKAWLAVPPTFAPEVPAELAQICARALAGNPADRFQSALELRDALRQFLVHRGSARLVDSALERLQKLEAMVATRQADAEARRWYALISECRFGFASALESNAQDAAAAAGLQRCLGVAAQGELDRGLAASARAFLSEMKAPTPALEEALWVLEKKESERAGRDARLAQLEHNLDPSVSSSQRNLLLVALSLTIGGLITAFIFNRQYLRLDMSGWARMLPMSLLFGVFLTGLALGRRTLLSTVLNRQLMAAVGIGLVFCQINRAVCVLKGIPVSTNMALDGVLLATLLTACGALIHRLFVVPAVIVLAGSAASITWPEQATLCFALSSVVAFLSAATMNRVWRLGIDARP